MGKGMGMRSKQRLAGMALDETDGPMTAREREGHGR